MEKKDVILEQAIGSYINEGIKIPEINKVFKREKRYKQRIHLLEQSEDYPHHFDVWLLNTRL